jgi:hypothetical protein
VVAVEREAVLDAVTVGVTDAGVQVQALLDTIGEAVVVIVVVGPVLGAIAVAVTVGLGLDEAGRCRRRGHRDDRGAGGLREALAELLGQDADAEAGRKRAGAALGELLLELRGHRQAEQLRRADRGLHEDGLAAAALEHHGVLVAPAQEVAAADLERLPDLHLHRRHARDDRKLGLLLLLRRSVGMDSGTRSRGNHEGAEGGHEGGAAQ